MSEVKEQTIEWQCGYCESIQTAKSTERHNNSYCECQKSFMDLEDHYMRAGGSPDILNMKFKVTREDHVIAHDDSEDSLLSFMEFDNIDHVEIVTTGSTVALEFYVKNENRVAKLSFSQKRFEQIVEFLQEHIDRKRKENGGKAY